MPSPRSDIGTDNCHRESLPQGGDSPAAAKDAAMRDMIAGAMAQSIERNRDTVRLIERALRRAGGEARMLTTDEIHALGGINANVAREALTQADKRLADENDVRKTTDTKATTLFGAYVTIALALFGVAATYAKDLASAGKAWPFLVAGIPFVVGAAIFVMALRGAAYGNQGSGPAFWLVRGRLDGDESALARALAHQAAFHAERIAISEASNTTKRRWLYAGMFCGLVGAVGLCAVVAFSVIAASGG